jgi:hypothetical protein
MFQQLLRRQPAPAAPNLGVGLRWPCQGRRVEGEKQMVGVLRCAAQQSKHYRLYLNSGRLILATMYLRRVRVVGRTFAAALNHISTGVTPPSPTARDIGVGLRRPCRGRTCGGMLGVMARIAPERPATRPMTTFWPRFMFSSCFLQKLEKRTGGATVCQSPPPRTRSAYYLFSPGANYVKSPPVVQWLL